jgi:regulator of microtubule dynamics protein 3
MPRMDSLPHRERRHGRAIVRSAPRGFWRALPALALLAVVSPAGAESPDASIAAGDAAYARRDLPAAAHAYAEALAMSPKLYPALWRLARVESEQGEDATGDAQKKLVAAAVDHARMAVAAAPDSAQGHVWLAAALGRQALKEGPKTQLALSRQIKSEADRAIAIDPSIGRAWHVRALWNRKLASLNFMERAAANTVLGGVPKGASMENAVHDLEKAVALEPGYVNHHLELGRTFVQLKRWPEARRELDAAIALPPTSNARDPHYQMEARELLLRLPTAAR